MHIGIQILSCHREKLSLELKDTGKITIDVPGVATPVELNKDLVVIEKKTRIDRHRSYTPNVIEPSFGVGFPHSQLLKKFMNLFSQYSFYSLLIHETRLAAYSTRFASMYIGRETVKATRLAPCSPSHPLSLRSPWCYVHSPRILTWTN